jgi:hypothetical protein
MKIKGRFFERDGKRFVQIRTEEELVECEINEILFASQQKHSPQQAFFKTCLRFPRSRHNSHSRNAFHAKSIDLLA